MSDFTKTSSKCFLLLLPGIIFLSVGVGIWWCLDPTFLTHLYVPCSASYYLRSVTVVVFLLHFLFTCVMCSVAAYAMDYDPAKDPEKKNKDSSPHWPFLVVFSCVNAMGYIFVGLAYLLFLFLLPGPGICMETWQTLVTNASP